MSRENDIRPVNALTNIYTADPHFGHERIIELCGRPFSSVEQMDDVLMQNLHDATSDEDDLWIIGDFVFGKKNKDRDWLEMMFAALPGRRKHLIVGNHDHKPVRKLPWDSIQDLASVREGDAPHPHTLCHYPLLSWNHMRHGSLQLFGHVHNNWKGVRNCVNVGVDVWDYKPVTFEQIRERARELPVNPLWTQVEPGVIEQFEKDREHAPG